MILEFKLPPIGEGVDSADIAEILIQPGDQITPNQIVMELETEKAVIELDCPHAGTVQNLSVSQGDSITVGQTLFTIDVAQGAAGANGGSKEQSTTAEAPAAAKPETKKQPPAESVPGEEPPEPAAPKSTEQTPEKSISGSQTSAQGSQEIEFVLPNIGEGVDTADIAEIHVKEGDTVARNSIVMDLETEKAVIELPCDRAGQVVKVHVSQGDTVTVGQPLLTLSTAEAAEKGAPAAKSPEPKTESARERKTAESPQPAPTASMPQASDKSMAVAHAAVPARIPEVIPSDGNGQGPVAAAPSTRRLARQLGVDLQNVEGTGPGGRITQDDVQAFVRSRMQGGMPSIAKGGAVARLAPGSLAPPPLPDFARFGRVEREKLSKLGRTAAENLTVSWSVIPHVTQHDRADVTELEEARKRFAKGAGAGGPKVTMTAIVMKALATCLQQYPKFNSSLDPETQEIVYKYYYHLGCAVDTPYGLLVPVVRDCDQKSIREIAGEITKLAEQARDRKLPMEAMQGATCTVTNLGGIGGVGFTPIVNYPEVCILGLSRGQTELQLKEGKVVERMMLPVCLSYDHRVINGADAARFVAALCEMLADPFQLLSAI